MSAWSGFGDYVEKLGAPMTGAGDAANFEAMLERALAAEAAAPPTTTYETTVCIIGGGVGGLAAAAALSDVGVACLVFERDASLEARRAGYGMTLSSDERGPLAHLKILQRCRELDCASAAHWVFAGDGSVLGYYGRGLAEVQECRDARSGSLRVQRQQLREVLLERVAPAAVHWNHQLARVDESDSDVVATFANGARCRCAALVGCDGVRSRVRELREARLPIELRRPLAEVGVGVVVGLSTFRHELIEGRGFYVLDGRARLFTMPFSATLTMWQLSFGLGEIDLRSEDVLGLCERYVATWENIGSVAASLIRETKDVWSAPFRDRDQMVVASVSKSRVTVLGDACHPMTCFKGQGANQALADAVLLARRVAEANDMPKALRRFEREMVQRAGPRAAASRCAARLLHSPSALTAELPSFARVGDSTALCERLKEAGVTAATPDLENAVRAVVYGNT
jgi:salicylate hydroxylase